MNKKQLVAIAYCISSGFFATATTTLADNQGLYINPNYGYFNFDDDSSLDNESLPIINLGYQFSPSWSIEAGYGATEVNYNNASNDIDFNYTYINGFYNFNPINRVTPYLLLGAGESRLEFSNTDSKETLMSFGAGLKWLLTKQFSIRADLQGVNNTDLEETSGLATIGISYSFTDIGQSNTEDFEIAEVSEVEIQTAIALIDSDQDGIEDSADQCADTPINVIVDNKGCMLDADTDGVANNQDQCSETPQGAIVDNTGCPKDIDEDGVADYLDQCPGTELGLLIDNQGCPIASSKELEDIDIKFTSNSATVTSEYLNQVEAIANFMARYQKTVVNIKGFADSKGSNSYNKKLSKQRADNIRKLLVEKYGVNAERITTEALGENNPIASNDTDEGRKQNRRVVTSVSNQQ